MRMRIRFGKGPRVVRKRTPKRRAALAAAALLSPAAVLASMATLWRIAAGMRWTGRFAISSGPFSCWQVWGAAAVLLFACARLLHRYGKSGDAALS